MTIASITEAFQANRHIRKATNTTASTKPRSDAQSMFVIPGLRTNLAYCRQPPLARALIHVHVGDDSDLGRRYPAGEHIFLHQLAREGRGVHPGAADLEDHNVGLDFFRVQLDT